MGHSVFRRAASAYHVGDRAARINRRHDARRSARHYPADLRAHAPHDGRCRDDSAAFARRRSAVMHLTRWTVSCAVIALLGVGTPNTLYGQTRYLGRPLVEVLGQIQATGVKIVYSSELVRADLRVTA